MDSRSKGWVKEQVVAHFLKKRGWTILSQNKKILGVETDSLAQRGEEKILIEVKSLKRDEHIEKILKLEQKTRLKRAALSLCDGTDKGLRLFLAVVDPQNRIEFLEVF